MLMNVVILGGGFCGATVAKILDSEKNIKVTLIDKNPFFEYNPSAHKCITNPGYQQNIRVPFKRFLSNTMIINESIKRMLPSEVQTESNRFEFDYAVCCMGSTYPVFLSNTKNVFRMTRSYQAKKIFKTLKKAEKILIVGGGYIGTEIAGELATKQPNIKLIMVHSHNRILERNRLYTSRYATKFLKNKGVQFIFNEKVVDHPSEKRFITNEGREIDADVCIWCAGIHIDTSFLEGFVPVTLDDKNRILVNDSLQFIKYPHLFAGGDITAINEEKTARKAELHGRVIAKNIIRLNQGKSLIKYKKGPSPMVISLGDNHGIGMYSRLVIPGVLAGFGKWLIEWWTLRQFK